MYSTGVTTRVRIVELTAEQARPVLRAYSTEVPVGVAFAKRSGMVRDGTADEFEALAGRLAVFRFEPARAESETAREIR